MISKSPNKETWDRIQVVFEAALNFPRESQSAFVHKSCEGDDALIAEIESLLDAYLAAAADLEELPIIDVISRGEFDATESEDQTH